MKKRKLKFILLIICIITYSYGISFANQDCKGVSVNDVNVENWEKFEKVLSTIDIGVYETVNSFQEKQSAITDLVSRVNSDFKSVVAMVEDQDLNLKKTEVLMFLDNVVKDRLAAIQNETKQGRSIIKDEKKKNRKVICTISKYEQHYENIRNSESGSLPKNKKLIEEILSHLKSKKQIIYNIIAKLSKAYDHLGNIYQDCDNKIFTFKLTQENIISFINKKCLNPKVPCIYPLDSTFDKAAVNLSKELKQANDAFIDALDIVKANLNLKKH
jgi:hypothetical protein